MPDAITKTELGHSMVANIDRGHPWHRLGQQVHGDMTIDEALDLANCDDFVQPANMYVRGRESQTVTIDGQRYVLEDDLTVVQQAQAIESDIYGVMGITSTEYEINQRRQILELAYEFLGLDPHARHIDTLGALGNYGEQFFAYVRQEDLVIDPKGICDTIERGTVVATSFNGSLANLLFQSEVRVVCANTLQMALDAATMTIKAKHTRNYEARMRMLAEAEGYIGAVDKALTKKAEAMLKVDGDKALDRVLNGLWDISDKDLPESTRTRRLNERGEVRSLYESPGNLNVEKVGRNGWAAYNATIEYLDHLRPVRSRKDEASVEVKRATAAVFPGAVQNKKIQVAELVLN